MRYPPSAHTRRHRHLCMPVHRRLRVRGSSSSSDSGVAAAHQSAASAAASAQQAVGGEPSSAVDSPTPDVTTTCTSHSCVVQVIEASLPGIQAKDGSVMTKASCYQSTVTANPGDTSTVACNVTYSDGSVWSGLATWVLSNDQVSWEPQSEVS